MPRIATVILFLLAPVLPALADEDVPPPSLVILDGGQVQLEEFLWLARPLVVFADAPADPRYGEQMELLADLPQALIDRDVVVVTDTDPAAKSPIRKELRPRGFMLALLAKDGTVVFRKPLPWDVREITRAIDKLPLRKQELAKERALTN